MGLISDVSVLWTAHQGDNYSRGGGFLLMSYFSKVALFGSTLYSIYIWGAKNNGYILVVAMQVLLWNPMDEFVIPFVDEFVIPFVEEFCRQLPIRGSDSNLGHKGSEGEGKELDGLAKGATRSPHKGEQDDNTPGKDGKLSFSMVFKLAATFGGS
jgi:hypothetical protein